MSIVDIFVRADTAADARAIAREVEPGLTWERTYAVADGVDLYGMANGWADAHPARRVRWVHSGSGQHGYRINGEVRS